MEASTKDTWLGILRAVLTLLGSYLVGHNLLGIAINEQTWQILLGAVLAVGATIWGVVDHSVGVEQLQSAVLSIIVSVGGIFVAAGKLHSSTLDSISGLVLAILPVILKLTSKAKVVAISAGTIKPEKVTNSAGQSVATGKVVKAA